MDTEPSFCQCACAPALAECSEDLPLEMDSSVTPPRTTRWSHSTAATTVAAAVMLLSPEASCASFSPTLYGSSIANDSIAATPVKPALHGEDAFPAGALVPLTKRLNPLSPLLNDQGLCLARVVALLSSMTTLPDGGRRKVARENDTLQTSIIEMIARLVDLSLTSLELVLFATVLIQRSRDNGFTASRANMRRVVIASLRLAAKVHTDEYFTISSMCNAAQLPATADFCNMVASCEWKLFLSLKMNCIVTRPEFDLLCAELLQVHNDRHAPPCVATIA